MENEMIDLVIDDIKITVPKGTTVYEAAKKLGIEIPIFCYHDRMPPFGACRMCLVEVEKMGKLQASCTLQATEAMIVKTQSKIAEEGRREILELLLINHPLDCPICDKAGECPLQDNTMKYGPGISQFFEKKRHFTKAHSLSPVLMLDRERCIACARCTRFSEIISGDHALQFIDRGYRTEVGTPHGKIADSKFIGNTIMICPVGALTSKVYRFRARPWDNETTSTTCALCPVGCSMKVDARDGEVMRTRGSENKEINDIWLCDKGWFGYEFSNSGDRLKHPLIRKNGALVQATWDEALDLIAEKIISEKPSGQLAAWGGNPLTIEENYLFQQLVRQGFGVQHLDHRIGEVTAPYDDETFLSAMEITVQQCESLDYIVLAWVDLTEEFPLIWLRLKQAINNGATVVYFGHYTPEIAPYLQKIILATPGEENNSLLEHADLVQQAINQQGCRAAIFAGNGLLRSVGKVEAFNTLLKWKNSSPQCSLNILSGSEGSLGAKLAGMCPDFGPLQSKVDSFGLRSSELIGRMVQEGWGMLHVAGTNPAAKFPSAVWKKIRDKLRFLVVQELFLTETALDADVVLPALCYLEKSGTLLTIDRHFQKIRPAKDIPENVYSDGSIFSKIADRIELKLSVSSKFQEVLKQERFELPQVNLLEEKAALSTLPIKDKQLLAVFSTVLFDEGVRMRRNVHLYQMVKSPHVRIHPIDGKKLNLPCGSKVSLRGDLSAISAELKWDETVAEGVVVVPLGFVSLPVQNLSFQLFNGMPVELSLLPFNHCILGDCHGV